MYKIILSSGDLSLSKYFQDHLVVIEVVFILENWFCSRIYWKKLFTNFGIEVFRLQLWSNIDSVFWIPKNGPFSNFRRIRVPLVGLTPMALAFFQFLYKFIVQLLFDLFHSSAFVWSLQTQYNRQVSQEIYLLDRSALCIYSIYLYKSSYISLKALKFYLVDTNNKCNLLNVIRN